MVAVALARHTKAIKQVRRAGPRRPRGPARNERKEAPCPKPKSPRIGDPLLDKYQRLVAHVARKDHVGAGDDQRILAGEAPSLVVKGQAVLTKVAQGFLAP